MSASVDQYDFLSGGAVVGDGDSAYKAVQLLFVEALFGWSVVASSTLFPVYAQDA